MASQRLAEGSVLGSRYKVLEVVGRGGMGTVYRARDTRLDSTVALKEMTERELPPDERVTAARQFEREAKLLGQLSHPNLPRVTDYFVEDERCYLVMEYVDGETLETRLKADPGISLPLDQVIDWGVELADTLAYLHSQSPPIVFRDLKPANVMVTPDDSVRLIDFGIARRFQAGATKDTALYGSPGYSPPEQYGRTQTDPRSDIYAFGATLHHLLTGRDPAPTPFKFPRARSLNPAVPEDLSDLIDHCIQMEEGSRVQTSHELREAMIRIRSEFVAGAARVPARQYRAAARTSTGTATHSQSNIRKKVAFVFAGICLIVIGGGIYAISSKGRTNSGKHAQTAPVGATLDGATAAVDQADAGTGGIQLTSTPPGAEATIDGRSIGLTPCDAAAIAPGMHVIKVIPPADSGLPEWSKEVEIRAGKVQIVDAPLSSTQGSAQATSGPSVIIHSVKLAHSSPRVQGQAPGVQIMVSFVISGAQGKAGALGAVFFASDHRAPLKPSVEGTEFQTPDGQLGVATSFQPSSDQTEYPNMVLFIPDSVFPVTLDQTSWRVAVFIDGKSIYESPISALQFQGS